MSLNSPLVLVCERTCVWARGGESLGGSELGILLSPEPVDGSSSAGSRI